MNPAVGWTLAALALAAGYVGWGWRGVVLGLTVVVFWLLLQFSQALRVMRTAAAAPKGRVPSAVTLHSRLQAGMRLLDVLRLTRSLGDKVADDPETFAWRDDSGAAVRVEFDTRGRCARWALERPAPT